MTIYTFAGYTGRDLPSGRVQWRDKDGNDCGTTRNGEGYEIVAITPEQQARMQAAKKRKAAK